MKSKFYFIIGLLYLFTFQLLEAQTPEILWERIIGGSDNDVANHVEPTNDGGFIIAGQTRSSDGDINYNHGYYDYWIIKLNKLGLIEWEQTYGDSGWDEAQVIKQTADGGYIIFGTKSGDYWLVKIDSVGNIENEWTYGGSNSEVATDLLVTSAGHYLMVGYSKSVNGDVQGNSGDYDYWIVLVDEQGEYVWEPLTIGSVEDEITTEAIETDNGTFIISGHSQSFDNISTIPVEDFYIIEIGGPGLILSENIIGFPASTDKVIDIKQTADGGYILGGTTSVINGIDIWIIKTDPSVEIPDFEVSNFQWDTILGLPNINDNLYSIIPTQDGGYLGVIYLSDLSGGDYYYYGLIKLNEAGEEEWRSNPGEITSGNPINKQVHHIFEINNNEFFGIGKYGTTQEDIWILKLGSTCIDNSITQPIITGDSIVCEGMSILLECTEYPGDNVTYYWETPRGVFQTSEAQLIIEEISLDKDRKARYSVLVEIDSCMSALSPVFNLSIRESSFDKSEIEENFILLCDESEITVIANLSDIYEGEWLTTGNAVIESPNDSITRILELDFGLNEVYWTLRNNLCPEIVDSDTLLIHYQDYPIANSDQLAIDISDPEINIPILLNDSLNGITNPEINILNFISSGELRIRNNNTIDYQGVPFNDSTIIFKYQVCSKECPSLCDEANVIITPPNEFFINIPGGITPNEDEKNQKWIIDGLNLEQYQNNELLIFNRWGEEVYSARPYENDWHGQNKNGVPLPEGVYYYWFKPNEWISPLRGSIHVFR